MNALHQINRPALDDFSVLPLKRSEGVCSKGHNMIQIANTETLLKSISASPLPIPLFHFWEQKLEAGTKNGEARR